MLIRVSGGKAGIQEYLESGIKNGRDYARDELDERVILEGDLGLTHEIIQSMDTVGEKYLHITLSFKEDHLDEATLNAITADFKAFAMHAYPADAYDFYAEAHLPKIKSYQDKSTGETIQRKPHIHVVIPEKNLATGKRLEPFGLVKKNEHYIDAFQEVTNEKYQLASPKHHVRTPFTDESTLISRPKADIFPSANRQVKTQALAVLLKNDVTSTAEFATHLKAEGFAVKVRHAGQDNAYLNIRAPGKKRGVNLKENVFQTAFVALPKQHKLKLLASQDNSYREKGQGRYRASTKHHHDLQHWHHTRAFELRYIHRRNRQIYKSFSIEQKQQYLTEKRSEHDNDRREPKLPSPSFENINRNLGAANQHLLDAQRNGRHLESGIRNLTHRRTLRTAIAHLQRHTGHQSAALPQRTASDRLSQLQYQQATQTLPDIKHIKPHINALELLQALSKSHGVAPERYPITQGRDGGDRVQCGKRHLNVSDFLTKEMHFSWKEAKHYLEDRYLAQQGIDPKQAIQTTLAPNMIRAAWHSQLQTERAQRKTYLAEYRLHKAAIYQDQTLSKADRNIALSIAQMNKVIQDVQFKRESRAARDKLNATPKESMMTEETPRQQPSPPKVFEEIKSEKPLSPDSMKLYDRQLQASRILIHYPKLKAFGINAESITPTEKGDRIKYEGKQLTVSQLLKKTHHLKPKEIVAQLKPIYATQIKDHERVTKYKNQSMQHDRESLSQLEKEKKTEQKKDQDIDKTIHPGQNPERETEVLKPEPKKFGENITHQTNQQGHVTYYQGDKKLVTDRGKNICVEQDSNQAIEIGLRLAIEKYGTHLDIKGTKAYQQQLIEVAVKNKLNISFKDKALHEQLMTQKAQFEKGEHLIARAEKAYQPAVQQTQQKPPAQDLNPPKTPSKGWSR